MRYCACEEKIESLYSWNVDPNKLAKVLSALYEQKLVSQNPDKKQTYPKNIRLKFTHLQKHLTKGNSDNIYNEWYKSTNIESLKI